MSGTTSLFLLFIYCWFFCLFVCLFVWFFSHSFTIAWPIIIATPRKVLLYLLALLSMGLRYKEKRYCSYHMYTVKVERFCCRQLDFQLSALIFCELLLVKNFVMQIPSTRQFCFCVSQKKHMSCVLCTYAGKVHLLPLFYYTLCLDPFVQRAVYVLFEIIVCLLCDCQVSETIVLKCRHVHRSLSWNLLIFHELLSRAWPQLFKSWKALSTG